MSSTPFHQSYNQYCSVVCIQFHSTHTFASRIFRDISNRWMRSPKSANLCKVVTSDLAQEGDERLTSSQTEENRFKNFVVCVMNRLINIIVLLGSSGLT